MDKKIHYPMDGVLDLHVFHPRDAVDVTREYLRACHAAGLRRVRIIHGKGRSVLRGRIRRVLNDHPLVEAIERPMDRSGWGAVIVILRPEPAPVSAPSD